MPSVSSILTELLLFSGVWVDSHQFYPPALTFSREESWSAPTFWSASSLQHPWVDQVASSKSEPFQTTAVFGPGACDRQLIHQSDSLPKPKKYSIILMNHSSREPLNTERAMSMDGSALVHWALQDQTSSEPQVGTRTCPLPRAAASPLMRLSFSILHCLLDPGHSKHTEQLHWRKWPKVPHCYHRSKGLC